MKKTARRMLAAVAVATLVMVVSGVAHAITMPNEPFERTINSPRMYVTQIYVPAFTTTVLRTVNSAPGVDPMLFATVNGAPVAASDDSDGFDPKVTLFFPIGRWVRVFVASFDSDLAGWTTFRYKVGGDPAVDFPVWVGGMAIQTGWKEGDIISSTSSYWGEPVKEVCEGMDDLPMTPYQSATWNSETQECDLLQANTTLHWSPEEVCHAVDMGYRAINVHSDRCEYASDAKDTIVLAMDYWNKVDTVCITIPGPDINTPGWVFCFEAQVPPVLQGADDDSGAGRNFRMTMDDDSIGLDGSSAFLVGLYPYITDLSPSHDGGYVDETESGPCHEVLKLLEERGDNPDAPSVDFYEGNIYICPTATSHELGITSDWIRLYRDNYRDRQSGDWANPDHDGLSSALENRIGTDPAHFDSDRDGIMDGLEIYGPIWDVQDWLASTNSGEMTLRSYLPLPYYGADPLQKNVVVEVDRTQTLYGEHTNEDWAVGLQETYSGLSEAGIHALLYRDGPNARSIIPNDTPVGDGEWFPYNSSPENLRDYCSAYYDLIDYPFARYGALTYSGAAALTENTVVENLRLIHPWGKYFTSSNPSNIMHELGHLVGLGHAGSGWQYRNQNPVTVPDPLHPGYFVDLKDEYQNQPNYWSRMSYNVTPLPIHYDADGILHDAELVLGRPQHFSREKMIDLDEAELYEWKGLMGVTPSLEPRVYQFDGGEMDGLRVDWVDWDMGGDDDITPQTNLDLDGDICSQQLIGGVLKWVNPVTGDSSTNENDVCPDYLEGSNDVNYLQGVDMSWFSKTSARGGRQYTMTTGIVLAGEHWPTLCPYISGVTGWWCEVDDQTVTIEEDCQ